MLFSLSTIQGTSIERPASRSRVIHPYSGIHMQFYMVHKKKTGILPLPSPLPAERKGADPAQLPMPSTCMAGAFPPPIFVFGKRLLGTCIYIYT